MQTLQHAETQNCYGRGWGKRNGRASEAGKPGLDSLRGFAPDLGYPMIEFAFDDVYPRSDLVRSQEIAAIAVLTALGNAQPQLKVQIHHALNVGCTRTQVVEAMLQVAVHVGFTAISPSTTTAKEVFQERDARANELNHA
ncbi:MAG: carboxymuconolactone decarboxylase family protein [Stenomitos rutilans HA7619-LM2]|jgi:4-carboxymuconolactone decarboxylase|nr:carboxymuconolactone decarboxylase family protein [Stenomitos rutilans HA7619-LM2]